MTPTRAVFVKELVDALRDRRALMLLLLYPLVGPVFLALALWLTTSELTSDEGTKLSVVGADQLMRMLARMLDPAEFLSPYGLRTLSRAHLEQPFTVTLGGNEFTVGYEPGESTTGMFGGNSNWRGPVWFPVNYLIIEGLRRFGEFFGEDLLVEYPTGSGQKRSFTDIADDLTRRLVSLFLLDDAGRRPVHGNVELFQRDERWRDLITFYEYFHGDDGTGLGAAHQTGWTALVIDMIISRHTKRGTSEALPDESQTSRVRRRRWPRRR